jgi:hypothetical protein
VSDERRCNEDRITDDCECPYCAHDKVIDCERSLAAAKEEVVEAAMASVSARHAWITARNKKGLYKVYELACEVLDTATRALAALRKGKS